MGANEAAGVRFLIKQEGDKMSLDLMAGLGQIDPQAVDALRSGEILKDCSLLNVLDASGNPLVIDGIYDHPRHGRIQILRESFGSGNCMDTYYRVYYRGSDFKESWFVVDASWVRNKQGDRHRKYQSALVGVEES